MRTPWLAAAAALLALGCAGSAPAHRPGPAAVHERWVGCPAGPPGPGFQEEGPLGGSATRLPRLGDDFRPVAVVVCVEAARRRPDGGTDLVATEYRGDDLAGLLSALRLSDSPPTAEPCPSDQSFPRWLALLDAQGRWVRPGTPADGCGGARPEVLHVVAGLRLRVARSHPVRELRSARAAAAGCEQLAGDRVAEFSKPDSPVLGETPVPVTFSGPVRVCVYRVFTEGFADFVRGGVLPAVPIGEPRAGAPCAEPSTLFAWLRNAEHPYRDGDVRVQLTGCRQMLIETAAGQIGLARADPALIALLSGPA